METIWIPLPGLNVEICASPVSVDEFLPYAAAFQFPQRNQHKGSHLPIVGISASEASRYAEWAGRQNGQIYRLPTLIEMQMLVEMTKLEDPIWSCRPDLTWTGARLTCPCEWLNCTPHRVSGLIHLHCVTHPLWLLSSQRSIVHAAFADVEKLHVAFRLVRLR